MAHLGHKEKLAGLFPPVITPFREDQTLDLEALAHNIRKMNSTELRGYMPLGSNGEFRALSDAESLEVVRTAAQCADSGKVLMVGAARESAYQTVEFIRALAQEGAHYVSVLSPHYFASKMNDDALHDYFVYVADRSPLPILLYCAPKFSAGVTISPALVTRLCRHPNIAGMKDTSGGDIAVYCQAVPEGVPFYLLSGSINTYLDSLEKGAVGGVLSPLNYMPERCCQIEAFYRGGRVAEAKALSQRLIDFNGRAAGKYGVPGVKAAMDLTGYRGGFPRNPLFPLESAQLEELRRTFREEGFLP